MKGICGDSRIRMELLEQQKRGAPRSSLFCWLKLCLSWSLRWEYLTIRNHIIVRLTSCSASQDRRLTGSIVFYICSASSSGVSMRICFRPPVKLVLNGVFKAWGRTICRKSYTQYPLLLHQGYIWGWSLGTVTTSIRPRVQETSRIRSDCGWSIGPSFWPENFRYTPSFLDITGRPYWEPACIRSISQSRNIGSDHWCWI